MGLYNPFLPFDMYYIPSDNADIWSYEAKNCNETHEVRISKNYKLLNPAVAFKSVDKAQIQLYTFKKA